MYCTEVLNTILSISSSHECCGKFVLCTACFCACAFSGIACERNGHVHVDPGTASTRHPGILQKGGRKLQFLDLQLLTVQPPPHAPVYPSTFPCRPVPPPDRQCASLSLRVVASGGAGSGLEVGQVVCLKEFMDVDQGRREVHALHGLMHPNVLRCYGSFETPRALYLVLELCSHDLTKVLAGLDPRMGPQSGAA